MTPLDAVRRPPHGAERGRGVSEAGPRAWEAAVSKP